MICPMSNLSMQIMKFWDALELMLKDLSRLSAMATEIGNLYEDAELSKRIAAKIYQKEFIAISDFDGTLYHKNDSEKTQRCIDTFKQFPIRVICSARPLDDLLEQLRLHNLSVNWIISYSGALITDGKGELLEISPLELEQTIPTARPITFKGQLLQLALPINELPTISGLRVECYQGTAFIANWRASKFRAAHRLLRSINWSGQVAVFGDSLYDRELLTYFDGTLMTQKMESLYV